MKKSVVYVTVIILQLMMLSSSTYAMEERGFDRNQYEKYILEKENNVGEIMPCYVVTKGVKIGFTIKSGNAVCSSQITPKTTSAITLVNGTFKIIDKSGNAVKTYRQNMKKVGNNFYFSATYKLPSKGSYYMKATMSCYKNNVKKETITKTSAKKTY